MTSVSTYIREEYTQYSAILEFSLFYTGGVCGRGRQNHTVEAPCAWVTTVAELIPRCGGRARERNATQAFLECLDENDNDHLPCKTLSKLYLECRMDRCAREAVATI